MKCPCENCILYAMCKTKVSKRHTSRGVLFLANSTKCERLLKFIKPNGARDGYRIEEARRIFKLRSLRECYAPL